MWIERDIQPLLRESARLRPVVLLTGARQAGKSSLLQHAFPKLNFVTLDLPTEAEQAERDGRAFLERHRSPLVIDEVQYAPGLFRHLKVAVDARRQQNGQFILTGSQKFQLMKGLSESLAGRVQVLELETLGWREIQSARRLGVPEVLWRGGFPELHANPKLDPTAFYRSYVATYLERDLRAILNVTSLRDFERFLRACALRSAQLLNKVDLARDVGVSAVTVNAWLGALQASNQVLLLEPWFTNKSKTLTKSPKLYLADTGLLCYLLNIHGTEELLKSPLLGAVWETFVFAELRKRSMARSGGWSINFYRDRGMEVDFVLESGPNLTLVEAKWGEHPDARDSRNLLTLEKLLGPRFKCKKQIVCNAPNRFPLADGTTAMSVNDISD